MTRKASACETCGTYPRPDVVGSPFGSEVPWLRTSRDVDEYPNLTRSTNTRHVIAHDKLLGRYDFRGNDWRAACSFPGGHLHAMGYVVQTVCGLTLVIGHKCGETWVDGLKHATRRASDRDRYDAQRQAMRRMIEELPGILPDRTRCTHLLELRRAINDALPHIAQQLREPSERRFSGLTLWRDRAPAVQELHQDFLRLTEENRQLREGAEARVVASLQRQFVHVDRAARQARNWFESALPFASPSNLRAVVQAFGVSGTVDDQGVITMATMGDRGRPVRIGMGIYDLAPAPPGAVQTSKPRRKRL
jgi:hypothetical protein